MICAFTVFTDSHESARESRQVSKSSFLISSIVGVGKALVSSISGDFQVFTASLSSGGRKSRGERGLVVLGSRFLVLLS